MAQIWRIKPIVPKEYNVAGVRKELIDVMRVESSIVQSMYLKTTKTWKTKPKFKKKVRKVGDSYHMTVGYDPDTKEGQIYEYVDLGTRRHVIRARRAPMLRFRVGGKPKTRPKRIASYKGKRGKHWRSKKVVVHPGTKARLFTATIHERRRPKLDAAFNKAMKKGIKIAERG